MRKCIFLIIGSFFILQTFGCATLVTGKKQDLTVLSNPPGATVTIDGETKLTPAIFVLDRSRENYTVTVKKVGYKAVAMNLKKGTNSWVAGNIVTAFLGVIVDVITKAGSKFVPDTINVDFINQNIS